MVGALGHVSVLMVHGVCFMQELEDSELLMKKFKFGELQKTLKTVLVVLVLRPKRPKDSGNVLP